MGEPWDAEPSKEAGEVDSFPTRIVRHPSMKHLCGYVGVPSDHPLFGAHYDAVPFDDDGYPHGGLTYADNHAPNEKPDGQWWFGFDCAHAGDFVPGIDRWPESKDQYRDIEYVRREVKQLAASLARVGALDTALPSKGDV
jgi:hypothetical protein